MNNSTKFRKLVTRYSFVLLMLLLAFCLGLAFPEERTTIATNLVGNVKEMISIIPAIFLLTGLAEVYVPKETVVKYMGDRSAFVGGFLAIVLGALAAGPLYAAFPVASMMMRKGASLFNVMIFVGSWSTLKIPLFLYETSSLGAAFSVTRYLTNIVVIVAIAGAINAILPAHEKEALINRQNAFDDGANAGV